MIRLSYRQLRKDICIGFGVVFVCTALLFARRIYSDRQMQETSREEQLVIEEIRTDERIRLDPTVLPVSLAQEEPADEQAYDRWERLEVSLKTEALPDDPRREVRKAKEINSDIVGILEAGDAVSGFVVQGTDNTFYLTHDYTGQESNAGTLFLDARCLLDPRSRNLIIHGHNMRNGTAFGNLKKYRDEAYVREHPYITLTWENTRETYEIYAVADVNVDPEAEEYFKITEWDFETEEEFLAFAEYFAAHSMFELPSKIAEGDRLLLLSTCSYTYDDGRQIVACRYAG